MINRESEHWGQQLRRRLNRHLTQTARRGLQFTGLFSLVLLLAVGCGGGGQDAADTSGDTTTTAASPAGGRVAVGTTLTARTLDPADSYETFPGILLYNMGDRLYTYAPGTTDIEPQLATELPTISDDQLTYTIPLREGVTLHDGTPFNAEVMAFSLQRFMDNGGRPAFLLADPIESVEATGEYELTIKLAKPFAALTSMLTFSGATPVPPEQYEIGEGSFKPDTFIGSGPYKLASFSSDVIKLDVNEDYWGDAPANEGIDIQVFTSPANLYNTFQSGGLDVAYQTLDPDQIAALEKDADANSWQVIEAGAAVVNYMTLNQKIAPFDQLEARQALAAMIDRNILNERAFQGQAEPLYTMIPPTFAVSEPVFEDAYGDGNYDEAKKLLAAAGFSEASPMAFDIWYPSSSTTRSIVANTLKEAIETNLPGLVEVTVNSAESAALREQMRQGAYTAMLDNWYPDYFDPENFALPFFSCAKPSGDGLCEEGAAQSTGAFYYSEKANELLDKQSAEADPAARSELFKELQTVTAEDVPYVPLWQNKDYVFSVDGVDGVQVEPNQQFLLWQ
ncbi:MAG: ABC transporter substrate-binding protein [Cyanobacteria bacterium J06632_22]